MTRHPIIDQFLTSYKEFCEKAGNEPLLDTVDRVILDTFVSWLVSEELIINRTDAETAISDITISQIDVVTVGGYNPDAVDAFVCEWMGSLLAHLSRAHPVEQDGRLLRYEMVAIMVTPGSKARTISSVTDYETLRKLMRIALDNLPRSH